MKFSEAMDKLKEGAKVTRQPWIDSVYFFMDGSEVKSYTSKLAHFIYNEGIMVSEGWLVDGVEGEHKFCDIIDYLNRGFKVKWNEWKEMHIYLDVPDKVLVVNTMELLSFTPQFSDFMAQDWSELK